MSSLDLDAGQYEVAPVAQERSARSRASKWVLGALLLGIAALALVLYEVAARHLVGGNSDGATVILEGQSIAHGNLTLSGWTLSFDSFWTIDALFYALAIGLVGLGPELLTAVPVVIATLVLLCAMAMAQRGFGARGRTAAVSTVAVLLLFPGREFVSILLQGPLHVGTLLYCLLAFSLLSPARFDLRWLGAVALMTAGLLGDLQSLLLVVVPVALCAVLVADRARSWRAGLPLGTAAVGAGVLALLVRQVLHAVGGFLAPKANTAASPHQILRNAAHLPGELLAVLGVTTGPFGPSGVPLALRALHLVGVVVIAFGVVGALARMLHSVRRAAAGTERAAASLEELLALAFLADLATLVFLPISNSDAYSRYATAGIVFGVVLGARAVARFAERAGARARRAGALGCVMALAVYAGSFAYTLGGPAVAAAPKAVAAFLTSHRLVRGVGDYWSSSILTVDARGAVVVRPVILGRAGRLVRYQKQSEDDWYQSVPFTFYVFDAAYIWNGDNGAAGVRTFGRPSHRYRVGSYEIFTYEHPFAVSAVGSDGP